MNMHNSDEWALSFARNRLERLKKMRVLEPYANPHSYEAGMVGYCSRCDTDGPCDPKTNDNGSLEFDTDPWETCYDRPFANEGFAVAYITDLYYASGRGYASYWKMIDGKRALMKTWFRRINEPADEGRNEL